MARSFDVGEIIRIEGRSGTFEVRRGTPDSDGEITVWDDGRQRDWSYVDIDLCRPANESQNVAVESAPQVASVCGCGSNQVSSEGTAAMSAPKTNRRVVRVHLVDEDAGLDVSKALVKDFGTFILEGSEQELIQEILMDTDQNVESALRAHNAVRAKEIDLDIRQRTGNEVKLQAIKLKDLSWKVTAA